MTTLILKSRTHEMATNTLGHFATVIETASGRLLKTLYTWQARNTSRRQLRQIDDRILADIGYNRADTDREAGKYFWQA